MANIVRNSCNQITIENNAASSINYAIAELDDNGAFEEIVESTAILNGAEVEYTFPNDGVFQVSTTGIKASNVLTASDFTSGETIEINGKTYTLQNTLTDVDGNVLITGLAAATQNLAYVGQPANGNTVTVNGKVYNFRTTLTDVDGYVAIGASVSITIDNLISAVNLSGGAGTKYAASTTLHPTVSCALSVGPNVLFTYKTAGKIGNGTAVSTTVGAWTWTAGTMTGGTTDVAATIVNIEAAIDLGTGSGTKYAASMTLHSTVENSSYTTTTLTVRAKVSGAAGNAYTATETGVAMAWASATFTDGSDAGDTNSVFVIYCTVQACMLNLINEIMFAASGCTCEDCYNVHNQKHYLYNSIKLIFYTLLASINQQYVDNYVYTALDEHDLEDLYFISQMIDKMTEYCECAGEIEDADCNCH